MILNYSLIVMVMYSFHHGMKSFCCMMKKRCCLNFLYMQVSCCCQYFSMKWFLSVFYMMWLTFPEPVWSSLWCLCRKIFCL